MNYFAYGSNLWRPRLEQRVGALARPRVARLDDYRLCWHKRSGDGSAKCDIEPAEGSVVHGAVYVLSAGQLSRLDEIEGVGNGYRRDESLSVVCEGQELPVVAYIAEQGFIDTSLQPYDWYHAFVVEGARELGLPAGYLYDLARRSTMSDPNPERAFIERALLDRRTDDPLES